MDFNTLASADTVSKTMAALKEHGFDSITVGTSAEALAKVKELIPAGASVMNGSSKTLEQVGFVAYLKSGTHGWNNLHEAILAEKDPAKQSVFRRQSVVSDYFIYGGHAITETGELVFCNASGSSLPPLSFTAQNLILVVSTKKIVPTLDAAFARIREHMLPLEDQHMKDLGAKGSMTAKWLILEREPGYAKRTVCVIFVNENLGY